MGVRVRYEFTSEHDLIQWRCDIHDADYAATINEGSGFGFQLTYNGNGDEPLANIKGSSARLNLHWRDEDTWMGAFINDLKAANEHEFALVVYRDSDLYWVGNITGDGLMWDNDNTPRAIQIEAIDGLGRLRDMPYENILTGTFSTPKQVFDVLLDLLSLNNLDQFWGASTPYIYFEPHWVLNTSFTDWLDRLSIPRQVFMKDTNTAPNAEEPKSAYECLAILLSHLNMRIIHTNGAYWLQQVMGMQTGTAANRYEYYKTSTPLLSSPYRWWQNQYTSVVRNVDVPTDVRLLSGGKFSYMHGLQRAELDVPDVSLIYKNIQASYATRKMNPTNCPFTETTTLGVLRGGVGTGKRFTIQIGLDPKYLTGALGSITNRFFVRITIKVIAGTYRLKGTPSNLSWTTTSTDTVTVDRFVSGWNSPSEAFIAVATPEIPWTIETVSMEITYDIIDPTTGSSYNPSPVIFTVDINDVSVLYFDNDEVITRSKLEIYNPTITDYENNKTYHHPEYLLDDFGLVTNQNSFQLNTTGTAYANVTAVDSGHSTDELISETILQDAMALQIHPIQVYEGSLTGQYTPENTVTYDGDVYVFNGGTFDASQDQWNAQWFMSSPELGTIGNPVRNGGKGYTYDGGDWVKPYRSIPTPWDHYDDIKEGFYKERIGAGGATFGSTITSLPLAAASESLFKDNDELIILNPDTLELLATVTLSGDVDASDTTMAIDSMTLENNIPPDAVVMLKGDKGLATPMIRTNEIQIGGQIITSILPVEYITIYRGGGFSATPALGTTWEKIDIGSSITSAFNNFTYSGVDSEIEYAGNSTRWFLVNWKLNITADSGTPQYFFRMNSSKTSTLKLLDVAKVTISTNLSNVSGHLLFAFTPGDTAWLEIYSNEGTPTGVTLYDLLFTVTAIGGQ